ncbi:hypothetical protein [Rathayibacter sp. VKM Ac-2630]|uniref:hypothetical protein n=1 Tax=Rathayibacter sp. VKM Ac-2630 TaxID=1938617 RepID=UPI001F306B1C|nr:hypothetical protein [Rathayibacter sp. VKM Ac-2630]
MLSSVGGSLLQGVDLDGLAGFGDLGEFGDITGSAGDFVSGAGEQVSGLGEQVSDFQMPDLGDLGSFFDR